MTIRLYRHQELALNYLRMNDGFALFMDTGPQPYDVNVLTPKGYVKMGDLKTGDYVMGQNGKKTKILEIFEKGYDDIYEIEFTDGATTRCTSNHLWNVQTSKMKGSTGNYYTLPLKNLIDDYYRPEKAKKWKWFIPMCKPVEFENQNVLTIDPYLLGVLLGDGSLKYSLIFSNGDKYILNKVEKIINRDYPILQLKHMSRVDYSIVKKSNMKGSNPLLTDLRNMGLMGKGSAEKFIPKQYVYSSVENRVKLLQGLFDTDAYCEHKASGIEYSTASKYLKEQVTFIVQSLGGTSKTGTKIVKGKTYYRLYIKLPKGILPFTLPRKLERYNQERANPTRSIRRIEKVGHDKVRCIKVENKDGLYLTDDFIVTHNTGKTLTTLFRVAELYKEGKIENCLVICPKPVIGSWEGDIPVVDQYHRIRLENVIEITNYEQLLTKSGKKKYMEKQWDVVILDESHYIKNKSAKRTKACLQLGLNAKYRYILTGTPVANGQLENIYSQFTFLYPYKNKQWIHSKIFGTWTDFTKEYCLLNQWYQPYKYINVDKLQDIISKYSYRVTKEECLDLPDKLPDKIFEIELKEKAIYKELMKHSTVEKFDLLADNSLSRMAKLRQVCSGFLNVDDKTIDLKCEKIKILDDFISDFDKKLVIFYEFNYSFEKICKLLEKKKVKYVYLNGKQKDKLVWKEFQNNPNVQVIVCQYRSGNAGINLYEADTIVFYEPTLSSNILEQARARVDRIGQTSKPSYIFFLTKDTIEEKIYKSLSEYNDFSEKLFEEYMLEYQRSYYR